MTHFCRNFLPDEVFFSYDRVFTAPEQITGVYNSCLHAIWNPSVQPVDVLTQSSSEELLEEDDDPAFWQQAQPTDYIASCLPSGKVGRKFSRARLG